MNIVKYVKSYQANKSLPIFNISDNKFGSLSDGYQKDLMAAVELNIREMKQQSGEAFRLLSLTYLLPHDTITLDFLTEWLKLRNYKTDVMKLLSLINQYSLIEMSPVNKNGRVTINMHELIQNSISKVVTTADKRRLINEASQILKEPFCGVAEKVADLVLNDNSSLLQAIKLSQEADLIDYHIPALTTIRVSALNILLGCLRDNDTSNIIIKHLQNDIKNKIQFTQEDELLYNANMALFSAVYSPNYEKAISYGLKAYRLATEIGNIEEKVRVIANLIQNYVLIGNMQEAEKIVKEGEKYLSQSKSDVFNALFIYAKTFLLLEQGKFQETIDILRKYEPILKKNSYCIARGFYPLNQLAKAYIKMGNIEEARSTLKLAEEEGRKFYGDNDKNNFFAGLYTLQGICLFGNPSQFKEAETFLRKGLESGEIFFKTKDKHRGLGFIHLQLGKLYHQNKEYSQAKEHYLKSEVIFNNVLKNHAVDDVSEFYKQLAMLGIDAREEELARDYIKKLVKVFGLNNNRTQEVILYADENGLVLHP